MGNLTRCLTIAPSSEFGALATNTVEAAKVTTNLRIITSPGFALWQLCPSWDALSVMYITESAETPLLLCVCFGKVKSNARPDQLITFTRCLREALPIKYRDLPAAARNQTGTFQVPGSIRDGWPLDTQHFGEETLRNRQSVVVAAVSHHE